MERQEKIHQDRTGHMRNDPWQENSLHRFAGPDGVFKICNAIGSREAVKRIFMPWIMAHVSAAILMYFLLTLHIAGEIYYGLRWLL